VANEIIQSAEGHGINLVGKTSLKEAMEILSMAKLVVTNDSGLMHVAAAFNLPTIAIFGSSSPTYTPPLSKHSRVVYQGVSCSPCFLRECPLQGEAYLHCLTAITPEHIYPIAESMEK
jgi:heptosyltransferase II